MFIQISVDDDFPRALARYQSRPLDYFEGERRQEMADWFFRYGSTHYEIVMSNWREYTKKNPGF